MTDLTDFSEFDFICNSIKTSGKDGKASQTLSVVEPLLWTHCKTSDGSKSVLQSTLIPSHANRKLKAFSFVPDATTTEKKVSFVTPYAFKLPVSRKFGSEKSVLNLRSVSEIPEKYRHVFSNFPFFNIVQSRVFEDVLYTDQPLVVCAPTGSGKTVIFELAIIRLLMRMENYSEKERHFKIVYMAPIKALCSERLEDWKRKFDAFHLKCLELTGDTDIDDYFELQKVSIILTTPEKWDSMTRRWRDNKSLVQMIRLFLVDEIHLLNDSTRGATIEAVVSRMKTVQSSICRQLENSITSAAGLRFLAVSATVPNAEDVVEWLGSSDVPGVSYKMSDDLRPVKLRKVVLGYPFKEGWSEFKFDISLSYKLNYVLHTYSERKPTLVFCSTRKGVMQTANILSKETKFVYNSDHKQLLVKTANMLRDGKLRDVVINGIGYHHAGLDFSDRKYMEELFESGKLPVLISTSTLAMGVNFPAHLVVVKSTTQYVAGSYEEYSDTQILQMIGRAGRPQFDEYATAVIMTKQSQKPKYQTFLNGMQVVESSLHKHVVEHLNAEIVLRTITDVSIAVEWLKSTFLYIRVLKNPKHYGINTGLSKEEIEKKLQDMCLKELNALTKYKLVKMDDDGFDLKPTEQGRLMARYFIAFDTIKQFTTLNGTETLCDLVSVICGCKEFEDVQLRNNEKKVLNTLNHDKHHPTIRFPLTGRIKTRNLKVNCLIQAALGCLPVQEASLNQDLARILRAGQRITKCLAEFLSIEVKGFSGLLNAIILSKCFRAKLWENSKHVSRQLEKIGVTLSNALVNAGITSFHILEETNPRELEMITNRHPPFGTQLRDTVEHLPKYEITIEQGARYSSFQADLCITLTLSNWNKLQNRHTAPEKHASQLIIGDTDNKVVLKQRISDYLLIKNKEWVRKFEVQRASKGDQLSVNLISEHYVGLDVQSTYTPFYLGPKKISVGKNFPTPQVKEKIENPSPGSDFDLSPSVIEEAKRDFNYPMHPQLSGIEPGRRTCNHHCTNKKLCGHDCCKFGVTFNAKKPSENHLSSFFDELHHRANFLPKPSSKRLKLATTTTPSKPTISKEDLVARFSYTPCSRSTPRTSDTSVTTDTSEGWDIFNLYQLNKEKEYGDLYSGQMEKKENCRNTNKEYQTPKLGENCPKPDFNLELEDIELIDCTSDDSQECLMYYSGPNLSEKDYTTNCTVVEDKDMLVDSILVEDFQDQEGDTKHACNPAPEKSAYKLDKVHPSLATFKWKSSFKGMPLRTKPSESAKLGHLYVSGDDVYKNSFTLASSLLPSKPTDSSACDHTCVSRSPFSLSLDRTTGNENYHVTLYKDSFPCLSLDDDSENNQLGHKACLKSPKKPLSVCDLKDLEDAKATFNSIFDGIL
ncbi:probable ATP-dependent DNA helicase HFM1 isoform X4 [Limulus polyphemus]|uniref:DNA 3'-5' helicase n=1 Tax=Limulus polyphemus TaxID=6850 RepID=A0ABM1SY96_LIMPO|nr:probable ATP-dependent DNA helicase HFM1 isoform X4 [Limulus polyphemus]